MRSEYDLGKEMLEIYGPQQCEITESYPKLELEKPYELPKGHQALTCNTLFAQENPPIGLQNINNIDGVLHGYDRLMFFGQLLADEHKRLYPSPQEQWRTSRNGDGRSYWFKYHEGILIWKLPMNPERSGSIFDMIANLYGIDLPHQQLGILAGLLGFNFSSLSSVRTLEHNKLLNPEEQYSVNLPETINMFDVTRQHTTAIMRNRADIAGSQGELLATILLYEWKNNFFCVPASIEIPKDYRIDSPKLGIGKYIAPAVFINQNYFSKYPNATIVFCQDIRMAIKMDSLLKNSPAYDPSKFFITSIFSLQFGNYTWEYLHYRNVIFIPAPTRESLSLVKIYKKYSEAPGGGSFKVFDHFILPYPKAIPIESKLSEAERYILHNSTYLDDICNITSLLKEKMSHALSLEEFTKKYESLGIFKKEAGKAIESGNPEVQLTHGTLPIPDPAWKLLFPKAIKEVKINHILKPENLVMLIGTKNAGKTQVSYLLAKSALQLECDLPLFSSNSGRPFANILIVDGESEEALLKENLSQHGLESELNKRLYILTRFQNNLPQWANTFALTNPSFREGLTQQLYKNQCYLLILDNLTALMGDAVNYQSQANEIITWIRELQRYGVCIVLLHHKSEDNSKTNTDKTDGSQIFKKLARTIINLHGAKEIRSDPTSPQEVKKMVNDAGMTVGIEFSSCKSAPVLETVTLWAHLPIGASNWKYICTTDKAGEEIEWPVCPPPAVIKTTANYYLEGKKWEDNLITIHPKASKIYQVLLGMGSCAKLGEIVSKFPNEKGLGEDTIRKILKGLNNAGFVEIRGEHQSTLYKALHKDGVYTPNF